MALLLSRLFSCHQERATRDEKIWAEAHAYASMHPEFKIPNPPPPETLFPRYLDGAGLGGACDITRVFVLSGMIVFFVAMLFGLFTAVMFCDQMSAIIKDQTGIEALQNTPGKPRSLKESMHEVMGCTLSWRWLVPTPVKRSQAKGEI